MEVRGFAAHLESWEHDTELFIGKFSRTSPDRPKKTPNFEKYHWKKKIRKILVWTDGWWHNRCSLRHSLDGLLCIRLAWTSQNAIQDQQNSSHRPDREVSLRHCWSSFVFETNCLSNVDADQRCSRVQCIVKPRLSSFRQKVFISRIALSVIEMTIDCGILTDLVATTRIWCLKKNVIDILPTQSFSPSLP